MMQPQWRQHARGLRKAARRLLRRLAGTAALPTANPSCVYSIGMYRGSSPCAFAPAQGLVNPVITREHVTDLRAWFVADPFMVQVGGVWHMFFEVLNLDSQKGEIALATSEDGLQWRYRQRVLNEPFHLSYPYVFESEGSLFMIPESNQAKEVRLYRAARFPTEWVLCEVLLREPWLNDASVFHHHDRWWMFVENSELKHDTLRLFSAERLTGPWTEHPASPIVRGDPHTARPGGRVVAHEGRVIRYAQDCHPAYGLRVRAFEVTKLTGTAYEEKPAVPHPILQPGGRGWNRCGMHHVDAHRLADGSWLACVDGWHDSNDPDWAG
jgi:hypothetical protein